MLNGVGDGAMLDEPNGVDEDPNGVDPVLGLPPPKKTLPVV